MNHNNQFSVNKEDKEAVDILVKEIVKAIRQKEEKCDRTYRSVIKEVTPKGYVVLDEAGGERTVKCCIPGVTLNKMQRVLVTVPCGKLGEMFVSGVW